MKTCVITFPGSNCDNDIAKALECLTGHAPLRVWYQDKTLPDVDCVVLPGGFSFGDAWQAGTIAAHTPIMAEVQRLARKGVLIIGICNGFQILTQARLLPGYLHLNRSLKFVSRSVFVRIEHVKQQPQKQATHPPTALIIAHKEGRFYAPHKTLDELENNNQIFLRYCNEKGHPTDESNPNGSCNNIAGIWNREKNIVGFMPHPERPLYCQKEIAGAALLKELLR